MDDAPELTSMTRQRTIRPLLAAWVFVFVILGAAFAWLSLSSDENVISEEKTAMGHGENTAKSDHGVIIKTKDHKEKSDDHSEHSVTEKIHISSETEHQSKASSGPSPETLENRHSLPKAPLDGLVMIGAHGPLPVLGPDSMVAWKAYARPYSNEAQSSRPADMPKIALIVNGIGLNSKATELAIKLPGQIDLGFSPYGRHLQDWMDKSRKYGHESFLMIPTEPLKYPENDPGPQTLLTGASPRDNLKKMDWLLSRVTGYVGVINEMGSKFTTSEADVMPILEDLNGRGLMFLDSRSTRFSIAAKLARRISMPRAYNNLFIDNILSANEIRQNLTKLENTARTYGSAVGVASAVPLTMREIDIWTQDLAARGFELVPVTAIAGRQPIR